MKNGVLADSQIRDLIQVGRVSASSPILNEQIQPASLDLRLSDRAFRVRASFLPGATTVEERLNSLTMHSFPLTGGAVLEKGCVYLVPLMEKLSLPDGMTAAASAKSSIGRLDLMTRIITDQGIEFDRVPEGYTGPLYAEICPQSFSVLVQPGHLLNQIIFRQGETRLSDEELRAVHARTPIVLSQAVISDGLGFSVDLRPETGDLVGYRAKRHSGVVDLSKIGHYDPAEYWEEVRTQDGRIILDPGAFYILVSREAIAIPP
ncbi:MAG: 2'-deoxycytidine 5'-triphosphate deaminase, partial [Pseudomonadota bacterium]